jgi:hypothetical protein
MSYIRKTIGVSQEPNGRNRALADVTVTPPCVEAHAMAGCDLGTCTAALMQYWRRFSTHRSWAYPRTQRRVSGDWPGTASVPNVLGLLRAFELHQIS